MAVCNIAELLEQVKAQDKFILCGKFTLIRIMLRYLKENDLADKVQAVYIQGNRYFKKSVSKGFGKRIKAYIKDTVMISKLASSYPCKVYSLEKLSKREKDVGIFVMESREERWNRIHQELQKADCTNVTDVSYNVMSEIGAGEHVHLDFLCVGFVKCGTSSLHAALKKNKKVFLPKKKETLYLSNWKDKFEDAPQRFNSIYFSKVPAGKKVGNIEPSYHFNAEDAYECYGKDTKIIFMVRNPISATYSYFKMLMRKTKDSRQINYYMRYRRFDVRMFNHYIHDYITSNIDTRFCYMDWIEEYLKYYGKEKIKIVVFEEFIKNPTDVMNEIQEFVGVDKIEYGELPHSNEGKTVSRNYFSALINRHLYRKDNALRYVKSAKIKKRHEERKAKLHSYTLIENNEKMLPESKQLLEEYYKDSIHRLEVFMDKSLEGIWY